MSNHIRQQSFPPVDLDAPRALAMALSNIRIDKAGQTIEETKHDANHASKPPPPPPPLQQLRNRHLQLKSQPYLVQDGQGKVIRKGEGFSQPTTTSP